MTGQREQTIDRLRKRMGWPATYLVRLTSDGKAKAGKAWEDMVLYGVGFTMIRPDDPPGIEIVPRPSFLDFVRRTR